MIEDANSPSKAVALVFARLSECLAELQQFPHGEEFRYFSRFPEFTQLTSDLKTRSSALIPSGLTGPQGQKEAQARLNSVRKAVEDRENIDSSQGTRLQLQFKDPACNLASMRVLIQSKWWKLRTAAACPILEGEVKEGDESTKEHIELPLARKNEGKSPEFAQFVGNLGEFEEMLGHLATVNELGVYVMHQKARSYQGFTRALGLVTRRQAFVIDAVALRGHLPALQATFSSPSVLKVMHQGQNWSKLLEKDLGIAVSACFDLSQAAKRLKLPSSTLTFLCKSYCGLSVSPLLGTLDWSCEHLSPTHISALHSSFSATLNLYDLMREELESKAGMQAVKEAFIEKLGKFSEEIAEKGLLGDLQKWRKRVAQMVDDNEEAICPTEYLTKWAKSPPTSLADISAVTPFTKAAAPYLLSLFHRPSKSSSLPLRPGNDIYERVGWKQAATPESSYKPLLAKSLFSDHHLDHLFSIESLTGDVNHAVAVLASMKKAGRLAYVSVSREGELEDLEGNGNSEEWKIPESVEEIYELANVNRKRMKKGKSQAENYTETATAPRACDLQAIFKELEWTQLDSRIK